MKKSLIIKVICGAIIIASYYIVTCFAYSKLGGAIGLFGLLPIICFSLSFISAKTSGISWIFIIITCLLFVPSIYIKHDMSRMFCGMFYWGCILLGSFLAN